MLLVQQNIFKVSFIKSLFRSFMILSFVNCCCGLFRFHTILSGISGHLKFYTRENLNDCGYVCVYDFVRLFHMSHVISAQLQQLHHSFVIVFNRWLFIHSFPFLFIRFRRKQFFSLIFRFCFFFFRRKIGFIINLCVDTALFSDGYVCVIVE